jgi:hypothetical protein
MVLKLLRRLTGRARARRRSVAVPPTSSLDSK